MDTRVWGPHAWEYLHTLTFNYPTNPTDKDKQTFISYMDLTSKTLPCTTCRVHFAKLLKKYPTEQYVANRDTLSRWLVMLHNSVNKRLGKPVVKYDNVKQKYETMRGTCVLSTGSPDYSCPPLVQADYCEKTHKTRQLILFFIFVFAIVLLWIAKRNK